MGSAETQQRGAAQGLTASTAIAGSERDAFRDLAGGRRRPDAFAWALWIGLAANGGVLIWLWLHGGGVSQVHGASELATSLGRVTGLVGAYLALIQIILLARLPPLERRVGFDRLSVWHRRNGKLCIYAVVAHAVLITIGYAGADQISVPREVSRLLSSYPGMVSATVGTLLMIGIVISSLIIVRRRLPYEAWYALHFTIYGGLALAYLHQLPTGNEFATSTSQRDYWIAIYVATLALLLSFRVARPLARAARYRLRVAAVTRESPDVISLRITGRRLERLGAQAGQFMLWRFLSPGRWWQSHPFSFSAAPDGRSLRLTVKDVGGFTHRLADIRPGTPVLAEGPFGRFGAMVRRRRRVTLIAGGIGITPLRALFEELPAAPGELTLIYRVIDERDLVLRDELERIAHERQAALHFVIGDHRDPRCAHLLSSEHLRELVPDIADGDVYVCGPAQMMSTTEQSLRGAGVPASQIHSERFALAL
jgi:predicted ferric reductase